METTGLIFNPSREQSCRLGGTTMIRRSIVAALAVCTVASFVGGCSTPPADASRDSTRNVRGEAVDPKTGLALPGQGGGAGAGGY
jgi:hypothetical protein